MKLIIQIPCLNEEETLPLVLRELPHELPGIDVIETLIIDDGSTDRTVDVARQAGVTHIISHPRNFGLARAFQTGLDSCLALGADIIVHTDADNQYPSRYIAELVKPIVSGQSEMVIGTRPIADISHFSPFKKALQSLGSWVVRTVSGTDVPDTTSGFRAYSRDFALRYQSLTRFSYTLETIIMAGQRGQTILHFPIEVNDPTRVSRLHKGSFHFVRRQAATIVRLYAFYEPLKTFFYLSLPFLLVGLGLLLRFALNYLSGSSGLIQSVSIGVGMLIISVFIAAFGLLADISNKHRLLTEETLYRLKKLDFDEPLTIQGRKHPPHNHE
ncbi:MAG: glycosyltransferase family 2 protein [Candidatus Promineifilaceae bacterium]